MEEEHMGWRQVFIERGAKSWVGRAYDGHESIYDWHSVHVAYVDIWLR